MALLRFLRPLASLTGALALAAGCAAPAEEGASSADAITHVPSTSIESQSIGNCWLYATAAWAESLHLQATNESIDISQGYWSYWDWFEKITGEPNMDAMETGGHFQIAATLGARYGLMGAKDFVPDELRGDQSQRQVRALEAINTSLKSGPLSASGSHADRRLVRAELDKAWALPDTPKEMLDRVFGPAVERRFDTADHRAIKDGTPILVASEIEVSYPKRPGTPPVKTTLATAFHDWNDSFYRMGDRRTFQIRVQRALHDGLPVIVSWFADLNALDRGSFTRETLAASDHARARGQHVTVIVDYQAKTKLGLLEAGTTLDPKLPEDKLKLDSALERDAVIELFRVKNSWGTTRADRPSLPSSPGNFDLYLTYLDGPVSTCDDPDVTKCKNNIPLDSVYLPPGY
jgi:hypothetical protein